MGFISKCCANSLKKMNRDLPDTPDYCHADTPCFMITVSIPVTGHTSDRAIEYLEAVLTQAKADQECEFFDWTIDDWRFL
jgi:hypothetical protein